jgi:excisionase family DNA binding protein
MARFLTVEEVAVQLGCHPETIRRAIRRRELLAHKDPVSRGPRFLIEVNDLHAFLEKRKAG